MYLENLEFIFLDRMKDLMKYQVYEVSATQLETTLRAHPGVLEAVAVPIPDLIDGEHPMAFVERVPGSKVVCLYTKCSILKSSGQTRITYTYISLYTGNRGRIDQTQFR